MAPKTKLILFLLLFLYFCFIDAEPNKAGQCAPGCSCGGGSSANCYNNNMDNSYTRACTSKLEEDLHNCPLSWDGTWETYSSIPKRCCENSTHVRVAACRKPGQCVSMTCQDPLPTSPPVLPSTSSAKLPSQTSTYAKSSTPDYVYPSPSAVAYSSHKTSTFPDLTTRQSSTSVPVLNSQKSSTFPGLSTQQQFSAITMVTAASKVSTPIYDIENLDKLKQGLPSSSPSFNMGIVVGVCICMATLSTFACVFALLYYRKHNRPGSDEIYAEIGNPRRLPYRYTQDLNREYTALKRPHSGDMENGDYADPEKYTQPPVVLDNLDDGDKGIRSEHLEEVEEAVHPYFIVEKSTTHEDRTLGTSIVIIDESKSSSGFDGSQSGDYNSDEGDTGGYRICNDNLDGRDKDDDNVVSEHLGEVEEAIHPDTYFILEKSPTDSKSGTPGDYRTDSDKDEDQESVEHPYAIVQKRTEPSESRHGDRDSADPDGCRINDNLNDRDEGDDNVRSGLAEVDEAGQSYVILEICTSVSKRGTHEYRGDIVTPGTSIVIDDGSKASSSFHGSRSGDTSDVEDPGGYRTSTYNDKGEEQESVEHPYVIEETTTEPSQSRHGDRDSAVGEVEFDVDVDVDTALLI